MFLLETFGLVLGGGGIIISTSYTVVIQNHCD